MDPLTAGLVAISAPLWVIVLLLFRIADALDEMNYRNKPPLSSYDTEPKHWLYGTRLP